jgi:phosphoribosylaminoimidazole carboxylase PurE protein
MAKGIFPMKPVVGIIMGSQSDARVMKDCAEVLKGFGVKFEMKVVSAHRTVDLMYEYTKTAADRGLKLIVAGAGGAAHLPGMVASLTTLPVIGVPVSINKLNGLDSLLSIAQMPKGIPVASVAIDNAHNAGLLAVRMLAMADHKLAKALAKHQKQMKAKVLKSQSSLKKFLK